MSDSVNKKQLCNNVNSSRSKNDDSAASSPKRFCYALLNDLSVNLSSSDSEDKDSASESEHIMEWDPKLLLNDMSIDLTSSDSESNATLTSIKTTKLKKNMTVNKQSIITTANSSLKIVNQDLLFKDILNITSTIKCEDVQTEKSVKMEVTSPKKLRANSPVENKRTKALKASPGKTLKTSKSSKSDDIRSTQFKQLKITELPFYKLYHNKLKRVNDDNISYPVKPKLTNINSSKICTDTKENIAKKSLEKKDSKYNQVNHNRLYENVKYIVDWVLNKQHYARLFEESEINLMKRLFRFSDKRITILFLRLSTRIDKWYNLRSLADELNLIDHEFDLNNVLLMLGNGFVSTDYSNENLKSLLDNMVLPDLKQISKSLKIKSERNKELIIYKLLEYSQKQCTLSSLKKSDQILRDRIQEKIGICVKINYNVKNLLFNIHLLYSLTNFNIESLNDIYNIMNKVRSSVIKYPKVKIDTAGLFPEKEDFLKYSKAALLQKEFNEQVLKKNTDNQLLLCEKVFKILNILLNNKNRLKKISEGATILRKFTAEWLYCKVLFLGSQNLGKLYPDKVCNWLELIINQRVFYVHKRGQFYTQLAIVFQSHKKNIDKAMQTVIDGLSDPLINEVDKNDLSIRGSKFKTKKTSSELHTKLIGLLLPKLDTPASRRIQANIVHNNEPGKKLQYVSTTLEAKFYCSVEEVAINSYKTNTNYKNGIHCEGQLLCGLFIIFFWDILFDMFVPNSFVTEIQKLPLDLFTNDFYTNRNTILNDRLNNIRNNWSLEILCQICTEVYDKHSIELGLFFNENYKNYLNEIIKCIGQKILAAVFERLCKNYRQYYSGMPDLFLWNVDESKCCFVEVKSEKDRLSTKQVIWMNYLRDYGANVEICYVEHIGSSLKRNLS